MLAPVDDAVAPVGSTVDSIVTPVDDTVDSVQTPVNDAVDAILTPVSETADQVVAPAAETVRQATAPLADAVDNATRPVAVTIADETAAGTVRESSAAGARQAETGAAPSLGGDAPAGGGTGPSGGPPAPGEAPVSADDPLGSIPDALASGLQPGPGVSDGPPVSLPFDDASLSATPFAAPPGAAGEAAAQGASDPTLIDAIATTATDPQVVAVTAVAFTIGVTLHGSRILCSGEGQPMFTNVRLLPCMIRESVQHHIAPLVSALPVGRCRSGRRPLTTRRGQRRVGHGRSARARPSPGPQRPRGVVPRRIRGRLGQATARSATPLATAA